MTMQENILELSYLYLKTFLTVVDEGTYVKAAAKLHISQSGISQKINVIESHLGMMLFERSSGTRKIILTTAGQEFYQHCLNICKLTENIAEEWTNFKEGSAGVLRLSASPSRTQEILQNYVIPFCSAHPDISYEIKEDFLHSLEQNVFAGLTELAFAHTPLRDPQHFEILHTTKEKFYAIISKESKLHLPNKAALDLNDLCDVPLSISKDSGDMLLDSMAKAGFKPHVLACNTSRPIALTWAQKKAAVAVLPISDYYPKESAMRYVPLNTDHLYTEEIVYKLASKRLSPISQKFLDFYLQCLK